jgi:NADPH:quinone reductase-like Zn-dependent oxidoreductase
MKAMTAAHYGGPETTQLQEVPTPTVGDDDVLVAVRAASLQALDWHLLRADPAIVRLGEGLFRPKRSIHGVDIAGVVEAVGISVDELEPATRSSAGVTTAEDSPNTSRCQTLTAGT